MAIALIATAKHHINKIDKLEAINAALHAARISDRDKFEAQTNVMMQAIAKKKGESP